MLLFFSESIFLILREQSIPSKDETLFWKVFPNLSSYDLWKFNSSSEMSCSYDFWNWVMSSTKLTSVLLGVFRNFLRLTYFYSLLHSITLSCFPLLLILPLSGASPKSAVNYCFSTVNCFLLSNDSSCFTLYRSVFLLFTYWVNTLANFLELALGVKKVFRL